MTTAGCRQVARLLALLAWLLTGTCATAQDRPPPPPPDTRAFLQELRLRDGSDVRMWLDARAHRITDLVKLTVEVDTPDMRRASIAGTGRRLGDLRILNIDASGPASIDAGKTRWRFVYTLEPLHDGEVVLRPLTIETAGGGQVARANTRALTLEVFGGLPAGVSLLNPRDIALPGDAAPVLAPDRVALAGVVAVALVSLLAYVLRRIARSRRAAGHPRAASDPVAECRARLAAIDPARPRAGWDTATAALRECMEALFDVPASRRTTDELRSSMQRAGVPAGDCIDAFLRDSDRARFRGGADGAGLTGALAAVDGVLDEFAANCAPAADVQRR